MDHRVYGLTLLVGDGFFFSHTDRIELLER